MKIRVFITNTVVITVEIMLYNTECKCYNQMVTNY
jgi:hypothetical protein